MPSSGLSRRRLLGTAAALAGTSLGLGACTAGGRDAGAGPAGNLERAGCVPRAELSERRTLAGAPLVYEVTAKPGRFAFEPRFADALERWAADLPDAFGSPVARWWTYGSWTAPEDGEGCGSWHHAGRAFDLARVRLADGQEVSARQDRWRDERGTALLAARRAYWRLAAALHRRFAYVLTYLYDGAHANHLHIDDGRSRARGPGFRSGSRVQVQAVQAVATYLWDVPTELSGRWDAATRASVRRVLDAAAVEPGLTEPGGWDAFLAASVRRTG